jgi:preprotein translocase subunit Sss1
MAFDLKHIKSRFSHNESAKTITEKIPEKAEDFDEQDEEEINGNIGRILHSWRAPEFEVYEKSSRWYIIAGLFIIAMVAYALFTNGPIMAITFILIGIVGYIHLQKDPRVITFSITTKGVIADKEMYLYENINSFWIFYDPNHTKTISLHTKASMLPFIHIPLADEDPVHLRELLMRNIPEIKQDPGLIDAIERVLHI